MAYSRETKLAVIEYFKEYGETKGFSFVQIEDKFGVPTNTISTWLDKYKVRKKSRTKQSPPEVDQAINDYYDQPHNAKGLSIVKMVKALKGPSKSKITKVLEASGRRPIVSKLDGNKSVNKTSYAEEHNRLLRMKW